MKILALLVSLLLLLLLLAPAGHSAHHYPVPGATARLLPLRVVRTPAVAQRRRLVRPVR